MGHHLLTALKLKLQNYGALRPEAWLSILSCLNKTTLKPNESFIRQEGSLAYLAQGLLKEYDNYRRKTPAIINFITTGQSFNTSHYNQNHYLKAMLPTIIYSFYFEDLMAIYSTFKELKSIYGPLCAEYEANISHRTFLLEMPVRQRIENFHASHQKICPYLKKKDMANYLRINYDHFVHLWSNRL